MKLSRTAFCVFAFICVAHTASAETVGYNNYAPSIFSDNGEIVLMNWNSPQGLIRLDRSEYKDDFYQIVNHYQPQINPIYCSEASAVMVLNALRLGTKKMPNNEALTIAKPQALGGGLLPFHSYTQQTFLNKDTDKIKPRDIIHLTNQGKKQEDFDPGLTLDQLAQILTKVYRVNVETIFADSDEESDIIKFRNDMMKFLTDKDHFIIVNYNARSIGAQTNGHISPIAAYDEESDSLLILDVAGHKNSWHWAPLPHLYHAMNSKDGARARGYLVISEGSVF